MNKGFTMKYLIVIVLLTLTACDRSDKRPRCVEWIETYERDIAAYEECKTIAQCEVDVYDVRSNLRNKEKILACTQEVHRWRNRH